VKTLLHGLVRVMPALVYAAWLLEAGTAPVSAEAAQINDKLAHAIGFALLAGLAFPAIGYCYATWSPGKRAWVAAGVSVLVGGVLEVWQHFLPHRTAEFWDLVADLVGAAGGACLAMLVSRSNAAASGSDRDH
jgi:VanZ family protein